LECNIGQLIVQRVNNLNAFIGVDKRGIDFYAGWLQDVKLALVPLSFREIYLVYTKNKGEKLRYQNECKCPNDYPINENSKSIYCLTDENNLPRNLRKISYLNKDTHIIEFINDNSLRTSWISELTPKPQKVSIIIDLLDDIFILSQIEVYFKSYPASDILLERFYNDQWLELQQYSLDCTQYTSHCISLPENLLREIVNGFTLLWSKKLLTNNTQELFDESIVNKLRATKVKMTLSGFYDVVKSDLRKLYYSISEFKIIALCDCNGYSATCNTVEVPYRCVCDEASYTQGNNCEKCLDSYNNRAYQSRYMDSSATCELCNCSSKSIKCEYNSTIDAGVCFNCKNNTEGPNCELCKKGFYRNIFTLYCEDCECNLNGTKETLLGECESNGQCECKRNVEGIKCEQCKEGYFSLSNINPDGCRQCICSLNGTIQNEFGLSLCDDKTGQCECKSPKITGFNCHECVDTYYDLSNDCSTECDCNLFGALNSSCNLITGQCFCKSNVTGRACDQCTLGYYNLTLIGCTSKCDCNPMGSIDNCDLITGKCKCKEGYIGHECNECADGYYETETRECRPCNCNYLGTLNNTINCERLTGNCFCSETTKGAKCDSCRTGYWGLLSPNEINVRDLALQSGCTRCDCDQDGTIMSTIYSGLFICDEINGQCPCKPLREGVKCDKCVSGYFLVALDTKECIKCGCHPTGTVPGTSCDYQTGECVCKTYNGVGGTRCNECLDGFYGFQAEIGL
jgi:usherin